MGGNRCDGCDREVPVAGGITNFWTFEHRQTGGLSLEFEDGSEHFLCFACIDRLPDEPTTADVSALDVEPR